MPPAEFASRMQRLIEQLKSTPLSAGNAEIFYPDEIEARNAERQLREGLVLPNQTIADLDQLADEPGVGKAYR